METRSLDRSTESIALAAENAPLYSVRWAAVIAGLAVGLGVHLVLMLVGLAGGLAVLGSGERPDGTTMSVAAAVWNSVSLLIAATVGGYIASRSSGLRRTADGVLHAVASWGASMICYVFLVSALTGTTVAGLFGVTTAAVRTGAGANAGAAVTDILAGVQRGDRAATVRMLQERLGMTPEQAESAADRALAMSGNAPATGTAPSETVSDAAQTASAASAWLSAVILLSLAAGIGGGLLGARGTHKRLLPGTANLQRRHVIREHTDQGLPSAG